MLFRSPDGSKIVSGSDDMTVRIWDAASGEQLKQLDGHSADVCSVQFSPDGSKIVSGSTDKTVPPSARGSPILCLRWLCRSIPERGSFNPVSS